MKCLESALAPHCRLAMRKVFIGICGLALSAGLAAVPQAMAASKPGTVVLDALFAQASADEIVRRLLGPVTQERLRHTLASAGAGIQQQTIRAGEEQYDLFVPEPTGSGKYGLLVFVYPADEFQVPSDWWKTLKREGLVFVAARKSGNSESVLDRRVPLALHGYGMAISRYQIDPERVYVGGFSGGSKVAQMIALGYPDIFRGALLFAGSDAIGTNAVIPPPRDLMQLFQRRSRIVFSTGSEDFVNMGKDSRTRESLADFCIQGIATVLQNGVGHWPPDRRGLDKALHALGQPVVEDERFGSCNQRLQAKIDHELDEVANLVKAREDAEAGKRLEKLDTLYGGLAMPRSVELARIVAERLHPRAGQQASGNQRQAMKP